jgi:sugar phosphate permease
MHFIWRRYSRSGAAPPWFYAAMALGFAAVAIWAIVARDWLVMALALAMIGVTTIGARIMRSIHTSEAHTHSAGGTRKDETDE